jgi:hypothetical protein
MIVKKTKQLGSFKRGINLYLPKKIVSAAPSGIPVASTANIVIYGAGGGNYSRIGTGANPMSDWTLTGYAYRNPNEQFDSHGSGFILFSPNSIITDTYSNYIGTPYSSWTLAYMYYDSEYSNWIHEVFSTNSSTNALTIPTSGWSSGITITAA